MDIVDRIRAVIWRLVVHRCELATRGTAAPDGALDDRFFGVKTSRATHKKQRPGVFAAIAKFGVDPRQTFRAGRHGSLATLVAKHPGFEAARELDQSVLWRLIGPGWLSPSEVARILVELMEQLGYYRATLFDIPIGRAFCEDVAPFPNGPSRAYDESLLELAGAGTIDRLALLCAMRLEAGYSFRLDEAARIDGAIELWMEEPDFGVYIGEDVREALGAVIKLRLVRGHRDLLPTPTALADARETRRLDRVLAEQYPRHPALPVKGKKPRQKPVRDDMETLFIATDRCLNEFSFPAPLVPRTPEIEELLLRKEELYNELQQASLEHRPPRNLLRAPRHDDAS